MYIFLTCSTVNSFTSLALLVITAIPSNAISVSSTSLFSSSFKSLDDIPISEVPSIVFFIPAEDPTCCISTLISELFSLNFSAKTSIVGPTEVDPDTVIFAASDDPPDEHPTASPATNIVLDNNANTFFLNIIFPPVYIFNLIYLLFFTLQ